MNTSRFVLLLFALLALNEAVLAGPVVIKRVDKCTVSPDADGCTPAVTKPPVDKCILSPDAEGCSRAVTKSEVASCTLSADRSCEPGYVWRLAGPDDFVCVRPYWAEQAKTDNENNDDNSFDAGGDEGHKCKEGFEFRYAFPGDEVCVTPDVREATRKQNRKPDLHRACN